jgi:hypothetical protein
VTRTGTGRETSSKESTMPNLITKPFRISIQVLLLALFGATATLAGTESGLLNGTINQRVKQSLNTMVQEVHAAEAPAEKRALLERFLDKAERGATLAGKLPFLSDENHAALNMLQGKFDRYSAELGGVSGTGSTQNTLSGIPGGDLDAFASFMQQDLEQADNGLYLSTGAIIIVLLIILILL